MSDKKRLTPTLYLYGCSPTEFASLTYQEALEYKIKKARELLKQLVNVPLMERDLCRITEVVEAERFNKALLDEMKESL